MKRVGKINRRILWSIVLIAGVVSVPLFTDYCFYGSSLAVTLSRIRVIGQGIGQVFPVRVGVLETGEFGYNAFAFQADLFYLFPAVLYRLGMSLGNAYKCTLLLLNFVTSVVSYLCLKKCCNRWEIGVIGSMLYTWCPYRCSAMYLAGDLGETAAWTFLPLLLMSIRILYDETQTERNLKTAWVTMVWGFSLVALSSTVVLSAAIILTLVSLLMMGRRTFQRKRLLAVGKAGVVTSLVNAWFFVPLLLRMRDVTAVAPLLVKDFRGGGMYFAQYLTFFNKGGVSDVLKENGMINAQAMGPGIAAVLLVTVFLWLQFTGCAKDKMIEMAEERDFCIRIMGAAIILMLLSLNVFPWDLLQNRNMICSILLAFIYTPAKLGIAADVCLIFLAVLGFSVLAKAMSDHSYKLMLLTVTAISFGTTQFLLGNILQTQEFVRGEEIDSLGSVELFFLTQETVVWRLCELLSFVSIVVCAFLFVLRRRRSVEGV